MRRPFLTIVIRTCRRPRYLANCICSILAQTCQHIEIVFLVDQTGSHREGNILWANRQFKRYVDRVDGQYAFILDDDGVLASTNFVEELKRLVAGRKRRKVRIPDAILVRSLSPDYDGEIQFLPPDEVWNVAWERGIRPRQWSGHSYNTVVNAKWWGFVADCWYNCRRGGDWHFSKKLLFRPDVVVLRLQGITSARSTMRGLGQAFEKCRPDWWQRIVEQFGIEELETDDWRLRLWR